MRVDTKEIKQKLSKLSLRDRYKISKKLGQILTNNRGKGPKKDQELTQLKTLMEQALFRQERRLQKRPDIKYPADLPICQKRDEIISALLSHQVIIISGETGSGKSTQLPKMCLEADRGISGKIVCTQPRRIAAITIATRIAEELGERVGKSVGYRIRFTDKTSPDAFIKIVTDGMLLAELQTDRLLLEYDTIIIDEGHERSLNIDFLLGILKTLLARRPDLKLIISSATLETEKFSSFFWNAPVITVSGRVYPVDVQYMPVDSELEKGGEQTYVDMALEAVDNLLEKSGPGDILVFMPTEQDIIEACERLEGRKYPGLKVLPLFARLPGHKQREIYKTKQRKVVIATNVAETSLTIPGIKYVVDTGLARISRYVARTRTTSLPISPISKASADQRKGRCGRLEDGLCIRLYSEKDYEQRPPFTVPEILRSNLAEVILRMIYLRLGDISSFPFLDRPNPRSIKDGFNLLEELGAIKRVSGEIRLTKYGKIMARMPLDPRVSRMMIEAVKEDCIEEVAIIASALSIQDPRERPADKADQADMVHAPLKDPDSDFITLINIWNHYHRTLLELKTQNKMRKFCTENFLSFPRMREWAHVYDQIREILREQRIQVKKRKNVNNEPVYDRIHRAILSGLLSNIAVRKEKNIYQGTRGRELMIFPGSSLFKRSPSWIMAAEIVKTSRLFARTVAKIKPEWIEELAGDRCKSSFYGPHWDMDREEVKAFEKVTLYGLVIIPKRLVSYKAVNPEETHEIFIRAALVEGNLKNKPSFLTHNEKIIEELRAIENKVRKKGIVAGEDKVFEFYSSRLPGVCDMHDLEKAIEEKGSDSFLKMKREDVLAIPFENDIESEFPDGIYINGKEFRFSYNFLPGKDKDGITISVPINMATSVPVQKLEWLVPGMLKEKIVALLKGLPKKYRKLFIPISSTAEICADELKSNKEGSLLSALSNVIHKRFGINIPASVWQQIELPEHLKMRVSLINHQGKELISGRNTVKILRQGMKEEDWTIKNNEFWTQAKLKWEMEKLDSWPLDEIPESISIGDGVIAYPGLERAGNEINLRLFSSLSKAFESHKKGVESLFLKYLYKELKFFRKGVKLPQNITTEALHFGGINHLEEGIFKFLIRKNFRKNIRTREEFYAHADSVKKVLKEQADELISLVIEVVRTYGEVRASIYSVENGNSFNPPVLDLCATLRAEMDSLVPKNFLEIYSLERISHLPRYLKAIRVRVERAAFDIQKDHNKAMQLDPPQKALDRIRRELSPFSSKAKIKAVDELRWMVEEFKVSLFAQELGTAYPVSLKRLEQKVEEIDRML